MEPANQLAIETLRGLLVFDRIEETKLRKIIAYTESLERKKQTLVVLADLLIKMGIQAEALAMLELEG
jgi:hypothetical protein